VGVPNWRDSCSMGVPNRPSVVMNDVTASRSDETALGEDLATALADIAGDVLLGMPTAGDGFTRR
jgi:hypothetical protein